MGLKSDYLRFLFDCFPSKYEIYLGSPYLNVDILELGDQWIKYYADNGIYGLLREYGFDTSFGDKSLPKNGKEFFTTLGFNHISIDLTGNNGSMSMDLSTPIDLGRTFDLVTDFGIAPHIEDQYQYFLNIFNFLKQGGTVVHLVPSHEKIVYSLYGYSVHFFYSLIAQGIYSTIQSPVIRNHVNPNLISVGLKKIGSEFPNREYFDKAIGKYIIRNKPKHG